MYNNTAATCGAYLSAGDTVSPPFVTHNYDNRQAKFTLIMVDPDMTSSNGRSRTEYRHWVIKNIPGNDISQGEVVTGYEGVNPISGGGAHRYVSLLYREAYDTQHLLAMYS
ncbi:phosphatidylethanolamine-binding protein [Dimargaris cristalligena]|uniref:Phosphatidylethanolamine-binding protein n=1 Tax=Dimargaris cristalligena TaxID=215637 RepID=A0A4P9ZMN1_9FUNG|nr:phosphatidylethanolamine-binding protein [Dimargaris cristalligena]|eukprot:RKP33841.1 phosphatidylethanolamine-binding protein [Dimargaris cristalligena]